jgi:hypothetical protein
MRSVELSRPTLRIIADSRPAGCRHPRSRMTRSGDIVKEGVQSAESHRRGRKSRTKPEAGGNRGGEENHMRSRLVSRVEGNNVARNCQDARQDVWARIPARYILTELSLRRGTGACRTLNPCVTKVAGPNPLSPRATKALRGVGLTYHRNSCAVRIHTKRSCDWGLSTHRRDQFSRAIPRREPSSLRRLMEVAHRSVIDQRLLDRVGQPQPAMVRESVEPFFPVRRALERDHCSMSGLRTLGATWFPSICIHHGMSSAREASIRKGQYRANRPRAPERSVGKIFVGLPTLSMITSVSRYRATRQRSETVSPEGYNVDRWFFPTKVRNSLSRGSHRGDRSYR